MREREREAYEAERRRQNGKETFVVDFVVVVDKEISRRRDQLG